MGIRSLSLMGDNITFNLGENLSKEHIEQLKKQILSFEELPVLLTTSAEVLELEVTKGRSSHSSRYLSLEDTINIRPVKGHIDNIEYSTYNLKYVVIAHPDKLVISKCSRNVGKSFHIYFKP